MDELDNSSFTIAARTEKLANDNNAKRIGVTKKVIILMQGFCVLI